MTGTISNGGEGGTGRQTHAWRSTEVDEHLALLEKAILLVELHELERCTRAVALFLGELVPLVQTAFAVLLLDRHAAVPPAL